MNSVENMGLHYWDQQRGSRSRVSESNEIIHEEMNSREQRSGQNVVVREWLIRLGLGYAPIYEIDDEVLPMLTLEDLKDMVISAVGSRRKMYSAILKLQKRFSLVHENHCAPTKKNKEWQKKLPVMVLKAEKIMCFKANPEVVDEWPGFPARVKFDPSDIKLLEHLATKIEVLIGV